MRQDINLYYKQKRMWLCYGYVLPLSEWLGEHKARPLSYDGIENYKNE